MLDSRHERFFSALFLTTNIISTALKGLSILWLLAVLCQLPRRVFQLIRDIGIRRGDVPVEQEGAEELFREICRELGIRRHIRLAANDSCATPLRIGIVRPAILLPYGVTYPEKELRMIFLHELFHYLHRDLGVKIACFLIQLLHWFNPAARKLVEYYEDWSETACDLAVCRTGRACFRPREYAEVLLAHVRWEEEEGPTTYSRSLYGTKSHLERRIERMRNLKNMRKPLPKALAALLSVAFLMTNSLPAFAASYAMAEGYNQLYRGTVRLELEAAEPETPAAASVGYTINEAGEIEIPAGAYNWEEALERGTTSSSGTRAKVVKEYEWDMPAETFCRSFGFEASAGDSLAIHVRCDEGPILTGIIEPDGTLRAVYKSGAFSHTFALDQTGTYRYFVDNQNTFDVFVEAAVSVL